LETTLVSAGLNVARTVDEVEALRPTWEELQGPHLGSDIDFFVTFLRHTPTVIRPHVVRVERDGAAPALVVARLEDLPVEARLGYGIRYAPEVRTLVVVYGGFLGEIDDAGAGTVLAALADSLRGERVDLVRLRMLTVGSDLHAAASSGAPTLRRRRFVPRMRHWTARVPESMDEFLAARSRERRKNVRRHARRLEEAYEGDVEVRLFRSPDQLGELYADCEHIHRSSYQHALGVGFSTDERERALTELGMEKGWFLGGLLYLEGEPVAYQLGNAYRGTYATSGTAFNPAHSELRPGTYVLTKVIEELCRDPSVSRLDFGFGDADYKRAFADDSWEEQDVGIFAPRLRPLGVNLVQTAMMGTSAAGRAALARTGRLSDVRRSWRSRLATRDRDGDEGGP
jgi:CelD/BcsL family acetyltransferase involved in cellulose biosynthesis